MITTLTTGEWQALFALPANNRIYNVPGIATRAIHKPATTLHKEQVIAETRFGTLRRRLVDGKWQESEDMGA